MSRATYCTGLGQLTIIPRFLTEFMNAARPCAVRISSVYDVQHKAHQKEDMIMLLSQSGYYLYSVSRAHQVKSVSFLCTLYIYYVCVIDDTI